MRKGHKVSDETREKMRISHLGIPGPNKGKTFSEEWINNLKLGRKSKRAQDQLKRLHDSRKGIPCPLNVRKKIGDAQRGIKRGPMSPETRKRMSEIRKVTTTKEQIEKMNRARRTAQKTGTRLEKLVEVCLTKFKVKFEREKKFKHPVYPGKYYKADFYLPKSKIDLECDSGYWHSKPEWKIRDQIRDNHLNTLGVKTIRISEKEIKSDVEKCICSVLGIQP